MNNEEIKTQLIEFKASQKYYEKVSKDTDRIPEEYNNLLTSYSEAVKFIELLEKKYFENTNKIPTKNEVESIGAMLDVINKIDMTTLERLNQLGGKPNREMS